MCSKLYLITVKKIKMKYFYKIVVLLSITFFCNKNYSQVMAQKLEWITIKSVNLRCWICKEKLEQYMQKENMSNFEHGIAQTKFNLFSAELRVQYYPDRISPEDIRIIMNNAGFDADTTKATESSYKKLPFLCKRAEDGGGQTKGKPCHVEPE